MIKSEACGTTGPVMLNRGNPTQSTDPASVRSVTVRSLLLALVIGVAGILIANYHDGIMAPRELSQHHYVAPLALASLFVFIGIFNTLLRRFLPTWSLRDGELAVALTLALIATPLSRFLASPWVMTVGHLPSLLEARHSNLTMLARTNIFELLPAHALLDGVESRSFDDGIAETLGGMAQIGDISWQAWTRPTLFWLPLFLTFLTLCISFGYLLYRQWAERELTPFPLAEVGVAMVQYNQNRVLPDIFYNRRFWIGFIVMVVVFTVNGLHAHFPNMIAIPTRFQFYELANQFSFLRDSHEGYSLLRGWAFFAVISVAVLLPSEISFTAWFTWPLMVLGTYIFYVQTGDRFGPNVGPMSMGATWAMAGMILYGGRNYYLALLKRALGWRRFRSKNEENEIDRQSIRICRVFLLSVVAFVATLVHYGVAIDLAILWTLIVLIMFLVVCRLVAEMGIPWIPLGVLLPLPFMVAAFGERVLGAEGYALLAILGVLVIPQRTTLMLLAPMVINAVHVESRVTRRLQTPGILVPFLGVILVLAVAIAIWMGYSSEGAANDYPFDSLGPVNAAARVVGSVFHEGDTTRTLDVSESVPMLERWSAVSTNPRFPPMFVFGAMLVLATGAARLRYPKFPLHPLPMVLLGSWLMSRLWFSFMIGWLIKKAILKIGGGRLFESSRPFFIGTIMGLAFIYSVWIVANIVFYRYNHYMFEFEWITFFRDMFNH